MCFCCIVSGREDIKACGLFLPPDLVSPLLVVWVALRRLFPWAYSHSQVLFISLREISEFYNNQYSFTKSMGKTVYMHFICILNMSHIMCRIPPKINLFTIDNIGQKFKTHHIY